MAVIESEVEDFPTCVGCLYYVRYECVGEPEDLVTCYRENNFVNRAWETLWEKLRSPN